MFVVVTFSAKRIAKLLKHWPDLRNTVLSFIVNGMVDD